MRARELGVVFGRDIVSSVNGFVFVCSSNIHPTCVSHHQLSLHPSSCLSPLVDVSILHLWGCHFLFVRWFVRWFI